MCMSRRKVSFLCTIVAVVGLAMGCIKDNYGTDAAKKASAKVYPLNHEDKSVQEEDSWGSTQAYSDTAEMYDKLREQREKELDEQGEKVFDDYNRDQQ